ncbi:hypothetical protein QLH52_23410 [Methylomonas sp. OY6]|uniref:Uncharacterized protein n=1 Tax=Methylomonas defluvii TaxID=3045149 RepID=A0ABU4UMI4_9GAMM|nr:MULTISPECIES: hypothetical protein [unclassified Methylomonas]MDX8130258.1 hypothetical protein [Methylomonas sp. OY6]PKD39907.1 hypothetical protein CWO84_12950 [Methylomonas sp. Kb3]
MAGHFILMDISEQELEDIQNAWLSDKNNVPVLDGLAHSAGTDNGVGGRFPGWTVGSRATLATAMSGQPIGNRSGLPPHKYIGFGVGQIGINAANYIMKNYQQSGWVTRLERPDNMGLSVLHDSARGDWPTNKAKAFAKQVKANGVSIEVYKFEGNEIN